MVQRIQTVYLLLVIILIGIIYLIPLAELNEENIKTYQLLYRGIIDSTNFSVVTPAVPLAIIHSIIIFVSVASVFLFKNRKLQMRLCVYNIILMLGFYGILYFYYRQGINNYNITYHRFYFPVILPFISAILTFCWA